MQEVQGKHALLCNRAAGFPYISGRIIMTTAIDLASLPRSEIGLRYKDDWTSPPVVFKRQFIFSDKHRRNSCGHPGPCGSLFLPSTYPQPRPTADRWEGCSGKELKSCFLVKRLVIFICIQMRIFVFPVLRPTSMLFYWGPCTCYFKRKVYFDHWRNVFQRNVKVKSHP